MKKSKTMKKKTKIIQVKNGFLELNPDTFPSGVEEYFKVYQEEATKRIHESELIDWEPVNCEESLRKIMAAFDKLFGQGACEKTFGKGVIPTWDNFNEFFDKLNVLIEKWWG